VMFCPVRDQIVPKRLGNHLRFEHTFSTDGSYSNCACPCENL
jgi:hypothetical protein